jgi:Zn-dependent protease
LEPILEKIAIWAIPILFAITVHEAAHGWVASKFGDKTALMLGRVTLNPLPHIDLIGTIILPLICLMTSPFIFGWAKPVPIDQRNLRHPVRDMALVAAAGPLSNFTMALFWGAIMKLGVYLMSHKILDNSLLLLMGEAGIIINLVLGLLNLIPIPPLDGSRVVSSLLPSKISILYNKMEGVGFLLLILLLLSGALAWILMPILQFCFKLILRLYGLL